MSTSSYLTGKRKECDGGGCGVACDCHKVYRGWCHDEVGQERNG